MQSKFTELDTERFYDAEDAIYRAFWDKEGSLHWGFFDDSTTDFLAASRRLNDIMLAKASVDDKSHVLDLGCGNGNTAMWIAGERPCEVTGVDLSGVRVGNAVEASGRLAEAVRGRLAFRKASATDLPFADGTFTHVWSQATIYHVHDKHRVLAEAYRVLAGGGLFVFDDLVKPTPVVSERAQRFVYDRLLFDTPFSFDSYQDGLRAAGFEVVEAHDLAPHLKTSYACLRQMALDATSRGAGDFTQLAEAYVHMVEAMEAGELGWGMYVCRK